MKSDWKGKIKAVILDMDGVLWRENEPIGNLPEIFMKMSSANLKILLATNNSTRTPEQYQDKLANFGVSISPDQVITSGMATAYLLKKRFPQGEKVFIVGSEALKLTLKQYGFTHSEQDVLAVVVSLTRDFDYQILSRAALLINAGADFVGTNPDVALPTPEGLLPGTGAILAFIEAATGKKPILAGKPYPTMMEMALEQLNLSPQEIIMVGDRLSTDIAFGQNAGCATGLVLSGISSLDEAKNWKPKVNLVCENLEKIIDQLQ